METSSDSAAYELTWSAKYTSTYPLDHRPLMVCLQLKEGRQQAPSTPGHDGQQGQGIIQEDRKSRKRKNDSAGNVKSRQHNKPTRIWAPAAVRSRGTSLKADSSTTTTEEEQWDLQDGDDIVQQSLWAMQQEWAGPRKPTTGSSGNHRWLCCLHWAKISAIWN